MTKLFIRLAPLGLIAVLLLVTWSYFKRTGEWDALVMMAVLLGIGIIYCVVVEPWKGWQ